jgi:hypothetical protein
MPQTAQEIWTWLVGLLPIVAQPYAGLLAACAGVVAGVATVANPVISLWRNFTWSNPGRMPSEAEVLQRVMDGAITRQDAKFILKRLPTTGHSTAKQRDVAMKAIRSMSTSGVAEDKAALEAFTKGDADKGFAALAGRLSKSARPAAAEVQRLGALAYVTTSKSAIAAYKQAAGSLGKAAAAKAQALLRAMQTRRNATDGGGASTA